MMVSRFYRAPLAVAPLAVAAFTLSWPLASKAQEIAPLNTISSGNISAPVATFPLGASSVNSVKSAGSLLFSDSISAKKSGGRSGGGKSYGDSFSRFASGSGNTLYLAAGTLLPLLEDGKDGKEHSLRTADSLLTSTLITEALKRVVREKRPSGGAPTSFPSGHATAAFAVATMQAHYHPRQALFWYGGATLIAASRVRLHRHYTQDVVAGAAVGYLTSKLELHRPRGLILSPFIRPRKEGGGNGLAFNMNF